MPSSRFDHNEQYEEETLTIVDEDGRSLPCYIEQSLELAIDKSYYLLPETARYNRGAIAHPHQQ
ncbi:MAG: hypothetical protein AAFY16_10350, partial [Cyanobacteria bacterium J06642_3]